MRKILRRVVTGLAILSLVTASLIYFPPKVFAGTLTNSSVLEMGSSTQQNPMISGDQQAIAIDFTTVNSENSGGTVTLTFTGWTGGSSGSVNSGTVTPSNNAAGTTCSGASGLFPGATALPSSSTLSASGSAAVLTITNVGALSASTNYCTEIASTSSTTEVVNPTATGDYNVTITVTSNNSDNQTVAVDVLSSGSNAYTVTAIVSPAFSMSYSGSTDTFASALSTGSYSVSNGVTWTIATNAKSGWFAWVADSQAGLYSSQNLHTINSVSTGSSYNFSSNTGVEHYGLGIYTVTGGTSATAAYTDTGHSGTGSGMSSSVFNEIASDSAAAASDTFKTVELADVSTTTPPATNYSDIITVIGSGSF
ncbi:MAG TPA: hypothetical protein VMR34_01195 [Candidatus Saccharimonadales bacterium]|nr:hypothetical protein [Candidatus Saccharimonadales bacterium]